MPFLIVRPEPSGHPGDDTSITGPGVPPTVEALHYEFDWWLGDDLVGTCPFFLVTEPLRRALEALTPAASGLAFDQVKVSSSPFLQKTSPAQTLPAFSWLKVTGRAGQDDMGISTQRALVVSGRVFTVLLNHRLEQAEFFQYTSRA